MATVNELLAHVGTLRRASGESQQALADRLGVRQSAVGNWETGRNHPRLPLFVELVEAYGHRVEIVPAEDAQSSLRELLGAAASLDEPELRTLVAIVEGWRRIPLPLRDALAAMSEPAPRHVKTA